MSKQEVRISVPRDWLVCDFVKPTHQCYRVLGPNRHGIAYWILKDSIMDAILDHDVGFQLIDVADHKYELSLYGEFDELTVAKLRIPN